MIEVTLLGCGGSAGVPMIGGPDGRGDWGACDPAEPRNRRTRSAVLLRGPAGERLLVDTGPDLRQQLLACGVPGVDAVLYTHAHADHILGLDEVRILNRIAGRPLEAYGTRATLDDLVARFDYAFRPWQPPGFFRPVLVPRPVRPGEELRACGLTLRLIDQDHRVTRTLGFRVAGPDGGGGFGYSTDVVALDAAAFDVLRGVDTWVVGCFQRARHSTHAHLDLVLDWAAQVGARRTILTHMGTDMDWGWLQARLPPGVEPGFDGMVLRVG